MSRYRRLRPGPRPMVCDAWAARYSGAWSDACREGEPGCMASPIALSVQRQCQGGVHFRAVDTRRAQIRWKLDAHHLVAAARIADAADAFEAQQPAIARPVREVGLRRGESVPGIEFHAQAQRCILAARGTRPADADTDE